MKKFLVAAATAVVVIVMAGSAFAATAATGNVTVNATVSSNCTAIVPGTLTLAIDPTTATEVGSTGNNTKVQCTSGTPYTVNAASAGSGLNNSAGTLSGKLTGGVAPIPYTLYFSSAFNGAGIGTDSTLIIGTGNTAATTGAVVAVAAANAAQAGSYSDQVTLTISY
jgi:spore coat protein U-like protein